MTVHEDWKNALNKVARDAKIEVVGKDDVKNESHAMVVISLLKAYGSSPSGFVYIEPYLPKGTPRPPDVLICHPDLGVLVIEVKGHRIDDIERVGGGNLWVRRRGYVHSKNVFRQAQDAMFDIKNAVERKVGQSYELPLFEFAVALPMIKESEWIDKQYADKLDRGRLLLKDDVENASALRKRLAMLVKQGLENTHKSAPLAPAYVDVIRDVFGDSAVINPYRDIREDVPENTLGATIDDLEACEKNLSREQQELSRLSIDGHPRLIRGVAGSGKTVVLANMVARYVTRAEVQQNNLFGANQSGRVAVICFNRVLVPLLKEKIKDATRAILGEHHHGSPDLVVTHLNGLMWTLTHNNEAPMKYIPVDEVPDASARARAYREQLRGFRESDPEWYEAKLFDAIFIDEGQDFEEEEYRLLMDLLRAQPSTGEKQMCIFYDDAQNVYGKARPTWARIGIDVTGSRSRVMRECFRNTRETIELAFNVLLGTQAPPTMRVATRTFADLSYLKNVGVVAENPDGMFQIGFTERTGPRPEVRVFDNRSEEIGFLSEEISKLISSEHVRARDILVLCERKAEVATLASALKQRLAGDLIKGIREVHMEAKNEDKNEYLFREGYLTIATTKSAKGYDAPIVFLVAVDQFSSDIQGRASFYVGATRAKYLLYLTGIGRPDSLLQEAVLVRGKLYGSVI